MAHDIIVIGASAGGVETVSQVLTGLPRGLPAAVFIVLHVPTDASSVLPEILTRIGPLPAVHPADGEPIERGRVYVAPPGRHLSVGRGHVHLTRGPRENGHRPAVDPLFRSAARAYGERVVGVVLSGNLDDGTAGLQVVCARGGIALVQDPAGALYPGMPQSALERVAGAEAVPLDRLAARLVQLTGGAPLHPARNHAMTDDASDVETIPPDPEELGEIKDDSSGLSCPECAGNLWLHEEGEVVQFRCRVGHAYSTETLFSEMSESVEAALWSALNALEEKADLARRMARRLHQATLSARRFAEQAEEASSQARILRALLVGDEAVSMPALEQSGP